MQLYEQTAATAPRQKVTGATGKRSQNCVLAEFLLSFSKGDPQPMLETSECSQCSRNFVNPYETLIVGWGKSAAHNAVSWLSDHSSL